LTRPEFLLDGIAIGLAAHQNVTRERHLHKAHQAFGPRCGCSIAADGGMQMGNIHCKRLQAVPYAVINWETLMATG
jgi:hypothetical protein